MQHSLVEKKLTCTHILPSFELKYLYTPPTIVWIKNNPTNFCAAQLRFSDIIFYSVFFVLAYAFDMQV